jgi:hypothetical protein
MRRIIFVGFAVLSTGLARAEGVSDAKLRKVVRRAAPQEIAALAAAEEAHDTAEAGVQNAQQLLHTSNLGAEAAVARVAAATARIVSIEAERTWAEAADDRARLADLFAEQRAASRHSSWRDALHIQARARQFHANRALDLAYAEREVREGVLELVRMRTYVELKGDDEALAVQIGAHQAALGRAEVARHDAEQAVAEAAALVEQAEIAADRLAP